MTDHYSDARERHEREREERTAKHLGIKVEEVPYYEKFKLAKAIYKEERYRREMVQFYHTWKDKFDGHC